MQSYDCLKTTFIHIFCLLGKTENDRVRSDNKQGNEFIYVNRFTVYAVVDRHMNNLKYFWSESTKPLLEGVHTIQVQCVSRPSHLSRVDETFSSGRWLTFCSKYNSHSYMSSRLAS